MSVNRGKQFEQQIREGFEKVLGCTIDRLPDQTNGFAGGSNICDFIAYFYPNILYLECKSCYGNTLNFHNITDTQWNGLFEKSKIRGAIAGVVIWFIDHNVTYYVPITVLHDLKAGGYKSFHCNLDKTPEDLRRMVITIPGTKKRILFDYDMLAFLEHIRRT